MPHVLRHGPTVYNGHLRGPVTLAPVDERLVVDLSPPVFRSRSVAQGFFFYEKRHSMCKIYKLNTHHGQTTMLHNVTTNIA